MPLNRCFDFQAFNDNSTLVAVENLLDEFFSLCTSNTRKHEIEVHLSTIKAVPHLGNLCLYFITNTSSHYVTMFALQSLEVVWCNLKTFFYIWVVFQSVINQQWSKLEWSLQEEIKSLLQSNLILKSSSAPNFLRNKYVKLLVEIAKTDWPRRYPDFFDTVLHVICIQFFYLMNKSLL